MKELKKQMKELQIKTGYAAFLRDGHMPHVVKALGRGFLRFFDDGSYAVVFNIDPIHLNGMFVEIPSVEVMKSVSSAEKELKVRVKRLIASVR